MSRHVKTPKILKAAPKVNIISYNSIITALGAQWKEVLRLLDELYVP